MKFQLAFFVSLVAAAPLAAPAAAPQDLSSLASSFLGGGGGGGASGPQGDVNVIVTQFGKVKPHVTELNDYLKSIKDTVPADFKEKLSSMSEAQDAALKEGTKAVNAMAGPVALMSAIPMQKPGFELNGATNESVDILKKLAPVVNKAGAKEAVSTMLKKLLDSATAFNKAINDRLPSIAQGIAAGESQKSMDALRSALKTYS